MKQIKALVKKVMRATARLAAKVAALPARLAAKLGAKLAGRAAKVTLRTLRPVVLVMAVLSALGSILLAALYICSKEE